VIYSTQLNRICRQFYRLSVINTCCKTHSS